SLASAPATPALSTLSLHDALPISQAFVDDLFGAGWPVPVRVAYPHLLLRAAGADKAWVIHHGHYLDDLVLGVSGRDRMRGFFSRSEEHTSELQSRGHLVCRLLLEK